jgi:hypothetical protein
MNPLGKIMSGLSKASSFNRAAVMGHVGKNAHVYFSAAVNFGFAAAATYNTPEDRARGFASAAFQTLVGASVPKIGSGAVGGLATIGTSFLLESALETALYGPQIGKTIVDAFRMEASVLTPRSIPFSQNTVAQDQAYSAMQYAQQKMGMAYSSMGSDAYSAAKAYMPRQV